VTNRQTDRRTNRILIAIPRLHYVQRGKNMISASKATVWLKIDAKFCTVSTVCKNSWRGRRNVRVTVSSSAQVPFSDIFGERTLRGLKILTHFPGQFLGQFCTPIFSEFSGSKHTPNSGTMYAPQRRSMISFRIPFGSRGPQTRP